MVNPQIGYLLNKALESLRDSNLELGELYLQQVIKFQKNNTHALRLLGVIAAQRKQYQEAFHYLNSSLDAHPKNSLSWMNLGSLFLCIKEYDKAITAFEKSIKLDPKSEEVWTNKGNALHELKLYKEALACHDKALILRADYPEAFNNKGNALRELKLFEEALVSYDKALGLRPSYVEALCNKGFALNQIKDLDGAIAHYDKALSLNPNYHEAAWNKSLSLLLLGDFENGLPLYESRWMSEKTAESAGKRIFDKPTWLGIESLQDKSILIYGEQGLGDFIQCCRYVRLVADLGARVVLEVPESLASLMSNLKGVSRLVIKGQELPSFDYQCPLLSLPLAFNTNIKNIPSIHDYINLDGKSGKIMEWKNKIGLKTKSRIGLVWSGNPQHKNDGNRSIFLSEILPYLPSQYEYVSLQKEVSEVDSLVLKSNPHILSFVNCLNNFEDTAALINCLDLVISVDTSVAHLSGSLGKKTLVLLPYVPDWRWLLDREDSPWYPSMKLFRQLAMGDWNSVLERLKLELSCS